MAAVVRRLKNAFDDSSARQNEAASVMRMIMGVCFFIIRSDSFAGSLQVAGEVSQMFSGFKVDAFLARRVVPGLE